MPLVAESAVAVLDPEVVGSGLRVWIFNFVYRTAGPNRLVVRRNEGVTVLVAEIDGVPKTQHDVVRTSSAHGRLVIVVADGVVVSEILGVRCIAILHVVERHGCGALVGRYQAGPIIRAEIRGLRLAVVVGADRHFGPGKVVGQAATGIRRGRMADIAVFLLPHLEQAMHWAVGVGVVGKGRQVRDLERAGRQVGVRCRLGDAGDTAVGNVTGQAGPPGQHVLIVVDRASSQALLRRVGVTDVADVVVRADVGRTAVQRCREHWIWGLARGGGELKGRAAADVRGILGRLRVVGTGRAVGINNPLREQVVDGVAVLWNIGGKNVVEGAVFSQ